MVGILHHCPKTVMKMHKYSGDLKSDHLKSGNILKSRLFEGQISNGPVFKWSGFSDCFSSYHLKTGPFKIWPFLSGFQMVGLQDFRFHSKSGPFSPQPLFDHSKYRLVQISDPHCMLLTGSVISIQRVGFVTRLKDKNI